MDLDHPEDGSESAPSAARARTRPEQRTPRIVVASDQALVADSVRVALVASGLPAEKAPWPDGDRAGVGKWSKRVQDQAKTCDVGVLLCDFDRLERLLAARLLLTRMPLPWVVLTAAQEGPLWGAVVERGARLVLPSSTPLARLTVVLHEVADGTAGMEPARVARNVAAWHAARDERTALLARIQRLSPREGSVLRQLYAGGRVGEIAARLGVSEATVRSQVRSVLRKLGVNSQLAAVAAYDSVHGDRRGLPEDDQPSTDANSPKPLPNIEESGP